MNQHKVDLMSCLKADTIMLTEDFNVGMGLLCLDIWWKVDILRQHEKNKFLSLSCWQTVRAMQ